MKFQEYISKFWYKTNLQLQLPLHWDARVSLVVGEDVLYIHPERGIVPGHNILWPEHGGASGAFRFTSASVSYYLQSLNNTQGSLVCPRVVPVVVGVHGSPAGMLPPWSLPVSPLSGPCSTGPARRSWAWEETMRRRADCRCLSNLPLLVKL